MDWSKWVLSSSNSHEGLIARPQSMLEVCYCWWMCRASSTLLFQQFPSILSCLGALPMHLVMVGASVGCHPIVGLVFFHRILVLGLNSLVRAWHGLSFHCWSCVSSLHSCASIMSCPLLSTVTSVNTVLYVVLHWWCVQLVAVLSSLVHVYTCVTLGAT